MTTTRIPQAFAQDGTRTPIETTRSDGVVNLDQGYTDDYSRELGVDPSAKAVERDAMNWLLWLLSSNLKDWQEKAYPQWLAQVQYDPPAFVRYTGGTQAERVFRCILRPPVGTIPTNTTYFEEVLTDAQNIARVPFVNRGEVAQGANWDNLTRGFWTVSDTSILTSGINAPPTSTNLGYLISYPFGGTSGLQMYYSQNSSVYLRSRAGGDWSTWKKLATSETTLAGYGILDALRAGGMRVAADALNLNTLRENVTYGLSSVPANWADLGWPANTGGTLIQYGATVAADERWTQVFYARNGTMYNRVGTRAGAGSSFAWNEWGQVVTSSLQVINDLLPRNNTWTGTNRWDGAATFTNSVTLTAGALASTTVEVRTTSADAILRTRSGNVSVDTLVAPTGEYGTFHRTTGLWSLRYSATGGSVFFTPTNLNINANRSYPSSYIYMYTQDNSTTVQRFFAEGEFIGVQNRNRADSQYVNALLTRDGDWQVSRNVRANGQLQAGDAYMTTTGNIGGTSWGNEGLFNFVTNSRRYILNGTQSNALTTWWDGSNFQWAIDGVYRGAMVMSGTLSLYWGKSEFLRPDQGGWWRDGNQAGQFTLPAGGVWAWFTLGNNAQSHLVNGSSGISAGGTFIAAPSAPASILAWRIY